MKVEFIDAGGVNTRVIYAGDRSSKAILLIHGFGIGAESWLLNFDELGKDYYVVAPDLVGHGFTDPVPLEGGPPHGVNLKHLFDVADKMGIDSFVPCGSSYGALMAALMWFQAPDRVPQVILNGTGSCFNTEEELASALQGTLKNAGMAIRSPTLASCRQRMANTMYDISMVPEEVLLSQLTAYAQPTYVGWWEEAMKGMMDIPACRPYRILERLEAFDVDTLIVWGREDPRGIHARAVEACRRMPRAKLVTFEKCGHLPYMEYPDLFHAAVRKFMN